MVPLSLFSFFFFYGALTSDRYAQVLEGKMTDFLHEFQDLPQMWFQHDSALAHKSLKPCTVLAATFGNNIIGYGDPVELLPKSLDLNPLDYFLWGF